MRSLEIAVTGEGPGRVRVVCQGPDGRKSLKVLKRSIAKARRDGYRLRPSQPPLELSQARARELMEAEPGACEEMRLQRDPAGGQGSGNNGRVVIMPGRYTEPTSAPSRSTTRAAANLHQRDSGGAETPSFRLPGDLPQRPEPGLRPGPRGRGQAAAEPPLAKREGIPTSVAACAATSRSRAAASRPPT